MTLPVLPIGLGLNPVAAPPTAPAANAVNAAPAVGPGGLFSSFTDLLGQAATAITGTQAQADSLATDLMTGQNVDIHSVMIAMQKAKVTFDLAVQVRNKVLDAYSEMMHLQM